MMEQKGRRSRKSTQNSSNKHHKSDGVGSTHQADNNKSTSSRGGTTQPKKQTPTPNEDSTFRKKQNSKSTPNGNASGKQRYEEASVNAVSVTSAKDSGKMAATMSKKSLNGGAASDDKSTDGGDGKNRQVFAVASNGSGGTMSPVEHTKVVKTRYSLPSMGSSAPRAVLPSSQSMQATSNYLLNQKTTQNEIPPVIEEENSISGDPSI